MTAVTALDLPEFDYLAPDLTGAVYHERLAEVAAQGWLARAPLGFVVLERAAGEFFLRSRHTAFPGREIAQFFGVGGGRLAGHIDANILNLSGDVHRRLRKLVGPAFTPHAADRWRPTMREFLARIGADIGPSTSCEFVAAVAKPYASLMISTVLGASEDDAPRLHEWSNWIQKQFDVKALSTELPRIEQALDEAYAYVEALLARHRSEPADDLVGALLAAEDEGTGLSHDECVNLVLNVLAGGVDTTQSQLAHGIRLFAEHPDQWALLRDRPDLVDQAVSEILRLEPITPFTARICVAPIEYRDVTFPENTILAICAERANREAPEGNDFDITAERDTRVLTFGAGAHYCLGANLARAELAEALSYLSTRMPELTLDGTPEATGVEGIYGMHSLPIRWSQ
ncbi:cytochrome P450 [Nocardia sp. NPDC049149]|uniref:cytochrome P450 n=1 Tax=Nocardia sp. NPDC049149 TaxID=3364315 RepID=UPI003717009A